MRIPHWPTFLTPLILAACGSGAVTTADVRTEENGNGAARAIEIPPVVDAPPRGEKVPAFPTGFQGRWAMVQADCRGDAAAKGLMTIEDTSVRFYESRGVTTGLATESATKVSGIFTFDGEGQRWRKEQGFELASDGRALVRTESDPAQSFAYTRCD